ncbi:MAG: hypothetical protein JRF28_02625 [Deltaproteobacteria bacterium]|nr:hypothetical protein [Deltaproteobacteria bacterium]
MTHEDAGHYARKHGPKAVVNTATRGMLSIRAIKGELQCAVAFKVAKDLGRSPKDVGRTADLMELRLVKCQLGLFGYYPQKSILKPLSSVNTDLEKVILEELKDNRLPKRFGVHKIKLGSACNALEIKIAPCQLGAF